MAIFLSPRVLTVETDLSQYPANVSSSVIAMVGTAVKGPVNKPVLITNPAQAIETFGDPTPGSYLMYGVLAALEYANQIWVVRIGAQEGSDALKKASLETVTGTSASVNAKPGPYTITDTNRVIKLVVDGGPVQTLKLPQGQKTATQLKSYINRRIVGAVASVGAGDRLVITSLGAGTNSTLEIISADYETFEFTDVTQAVHAGTVSETFEIIADNNDKLLIVVNGGVEQEVTLTPNSSANAADICDDINNQVEGVIAVENSGKVDIKSKVQGSSASVELVAIANNAYTTLGLTVGIMSGMSSISPGVDSTDKIFAFEAVNEGTWGNDLAVQIVNQPNNKLAISIFQNGIEVEGFTNMVYGAANAGDDNYVEKVINGDDVTRGSAFIRIVENTSVSGTPKSLNASQHDAKLRGGKNGIDGVTDGDYIGEAFDEVLRGPTGLQIFANVETIDINLLAVPGNSSASVIREMLSVCERRGDTMCIIDPPFGLTVQEVVDWHNGQGFGNESAFNSSYGAIYWSWVKVYDRTNKQNIWLPPSGYVLGQYALTDVIAEPWFAPAGLTRGRMLSPLRVEISPTQGERDYMYSQGNAINPIVNFIKDGLVIWGQRTLQRSASALDRVNVRRLLLYLRKIAANTSRILVFEPHDPITWRRARDLFTPLLQDVMERRGISDYKVVCDETNNTPARIDRNELAIDIYIKPIKSVEYIKINFVILSQGASVEESIE